MAVREQFKAQSDLAKSFGEDRDRLAGDVDRLKLPPEEEARKRANAAKISSYMGQANYVQ